METDSSAADDARRDARIDQNAMTTQLRCRAGSARNTTSFAWKYCSKTRVDSQLSSIKTTTERDAFQDKILCSWIYYLNMLTYLYTSMLILLHMVKIHLWLFTHCAEALD